MALFSASEINCKYIYYMNRFRADKID